jgi:hypothetical protein
LRIVEDTALVVNIAERHAGGAAAQPLLANVFSVFANGFVPRTARETEGNPEPRFSPIVSTIAACKYSIHDLSRFRGEGDENLARLNMPLELGMAAAFRFEREKTDRPHRWRGMTVMVACSLAHADGALLVRMNKPA